MGDDDTHMRSDERFLWVAGIWRGELLHHLDPATPDRNSWIGCRNGWDTIWSHSNGYSYLVLKRLKTDRYFVTDHKRFVLICDGGPFKFFDDEDAAIMYAVMKANQQ